MPDSRFAVPLPGNLPVTNESTVHVIDDDDAARDSIVFLLSAAGFSVCAHASAKAFLETISDGQAGCIVTDVRMPDIDGLDLLRRLKGLKLEWPVIVMTGQADIPIAVQAIKLGAVDFLEKPFDADTLIDGVRFALGDRADHGRDVQRSDIQQRLAILSPLERQVLDALVEGRFDKLITPGSGLSERTVALHRANMMSKMQATGLAHLVRLTLIAGHQI